MEGVKRPGFLYIFAINCPGHIGKIASFLWVSACAVVKSERVSLEAPCGPFGPASYDFLVTGVRTIANVKHSPSWQ